MTTESNLTLQHDYDVEKAKNFLKRDDYIIFTKDEFGNLKAKTLAYIFAVIIVTFLLGFLLCGMVGGRC